MAVVGREVNRGGSGLPLVFGAGGAQSAPVPMPTMMRLYTVILLWFLSLACPGQVPKIFADLLAEDALVKGMVVDVVMPPEMDKYLAKVELAVRKDQEWAAKFFKESKGDLPLVYHEKLGLTKEEYDEYLKLWNARELRPLAQVVLQLRKGKPGEWMVVATGAGNVLSTLRYLEKEDSFQSPNGKLARIGEIDAVPESTLGAWKGSEWKFEETSEFGKLKENFAVGRTADGKNGMIVYRMQEVSSQGKPLYAKRLVVRFALGAAGKVTPAATKQEPPPKKQAPAKKPTSTKGSGTKGR